MKIGEEIFAIPRKDGQYYLYAPLRRRLAVVNKTAVEAVARHLETAEPDSSRTESEVIGELRQQGFLGEPYPSAPVFPENYTFMPHEVTLFPTSRCNLRCRYCYAESGHKIADMPWEVARAAIDLVASNAGLLGSRNFAVGVHGGGEPTVAWETVKRCVDYAEQKAEETGLDVEIYAATNGLLSPKQRETIVKHFTTLTVSLDGPRDIQDYNRPKVSGKGSYDEISETLKYFTEKEFHFGIRTTVTRAMVDRLVELIEHLHQEFNIDYLHLEPVWQCGRCVTSKEETPADEAFISNFRKVVHRGRELDVEVSYSGARLETLTSKFCGAAGDGFSVLPEGIVTSCYEITEVTDPRAAIFHYGGYDFEKKCFVFDENRISALQKLSVENLAFCRDCFCRWHCAGDCLARVFQNASEATHTGSIRCQINRKLTLASMEDLVMQAGNDVFAHEEKGGKL